MKVILMYDAGVDKVVSSSEAKFEAENFSSYPIYTNVIFFLQFSLSFTESNAPPFCPRLCMCGLHLRRIYLKNLMFFSIFRLTLSHGDPEVNSRLKSPLGDNSNPIALKR